MKERRNVFRKYKALPVMVRASMWFMVCSVLQKSISFITTPIFTRIMDVEQYGYYNTYLSWLQIITVFATLNMHSCVFINGLAKNETEQENDQLAVSLLSLSFCLTGILFVLYLIFHTWVNSVTGMTTPLFLLMFVEILFHPALLFWMSKQRFKYKYVLMVLVTLLTTLGNAGLGIVFVLHSPADNAVFARVLSIVLVQAIVGGCCWIYFMRRAGKIASFSQWKHALKVEIPLIPHELSAIVLASSDRIMINSLVGASAAGLYSLAYSIALVVKSVKDSILDGIKPWVYARIKNGKLVQVRQLLKTIMFFILMLSVLAMALAPEAVYIMGGERYQEAIYAIPPVIGSIVFMFIYNICVMMESYYEEVDKITVVSVICAALNIGLNFWLIPVFGFIAAGYTTLICYFIFAVLHYIIVRGLCKRKYGGVQVLETKFFLFISAVILILIAGMTFLYQNSILRYAFMVIVLLLSIYQGRKIFRFSREVKNEK